MGRRGVSLDDVRDIVKSLEEENESVTIMTVRNRLGTGSMSTIQSHLASLRNEQNTQNRQKLDIPEELKQSSEAMLMKVWEIAESLASSDVEMLRRITALEIAQLSKGMSEMCATYDKLSEEHESCKEQLRSEQAQRVQLEKSLVEAVSARSALEVHCNALTEHFNESLKTVETLMTSLQKQVIASKMSEKE